MSSGPIIPSKDALRALRNLAFSSSAAFVGVTGSLCGVAAIHYHECRRLHLAEKIVDRKRKLHSISNGKGAARIALMFEAAEKGEDFTLDRNRRRKLSEKRHHSVAAAQLDQEIIRPLDDILTEPNDVINSVEFEPLNASMEQQAEWTQRAPRSRHISPSLLADLPWRVSRVFEEFAIMRPFRSANTDTVPQELTDLNPLRQASEKLEEFDVMSSEGSNIFTSMNPWYMNYEEAPTGVDVGIQEVSKAPDTNPVLPNTYLSSSQTPPNVQQRHRFSSRYDTNNSSVRKGLDSIGAQRYFYVFNTIMNLRHEAGNHASVDLLEHTMKLYTATGRHEDWVFVQTLFLDCAGNFPVSDLRPIVWRLVEAFLQGESPRLEVVSLLYPRCGAGHKSERQHYYFLAHTYLEYRCVKCDNFDEQLIELRKVLAGTQNCNITLHEHLFIPTLRYLCLSGNMTRAEALIEEMKSVYKVPTSFYTLQELVKGYARLRNWSKIKNILDTCHRDSLSFCKAYGVSGLLNHVITEYIKVGTPQSLHRFVSHCIHEYRLQPTSQITRKLVSVYLLHRQFDLVAAWIKTVTEQYPHIDTGTSNSKFAFDVSCTWERMDASCEDILLSCRAITNYSLRDPFSRSFRGVAAEAISKCLDARLKQLEKVTGIEMPRLPHGQMDGLQTIMDQIEQRGVHRMRGGRISILLEDLKAQISALHALNALFHGHSQVIQPTIRSTYQASSRVDIHRVHNRLPEISEVERSIQDEYSEQVRIGDSVRHDYLQTTVSKLVDEGRNVDAFDLIQKIYESQWTKPCTGREYDKRLFTDWVQIASGLISGSKLRYVLWAIVDASPMLKVDSHILLLAKISLQRAHASRYKDARFEETREAEYLKKRLSRRRLATAGYKLGVWFDEWSGMSKEYYQPEMPKI